MKIDEIVLSTIDLGWEFHLKLKGKEYAPYSIKMERKYNEKVSIIKKLILQYSPETLIRFISDANTIEERRCLKKYKTAFCAAFPQIFKPIFFHGPKWGVVNFHPSYLPRCRGAHPIYWTIANQEEYGGISSHFITKKIDHGTIISRLKIEIDKTQINYKKLFDLVDKHLPLSIETCINNLKKNQFVTRIEEQTSFNKNERDEDCRIRWSVDKVERISTKIRSSGAFSYLKSGEKIYLTYPIVLHNNTQSNLINGTILDITKNGILVQISNGQISCLVDYSYSYVERIFLFFSKIYPPFQKLIFLFLWKIKFSKEAFVEESKP